MAELDLDRVNEATARASEYVRECIRSGRLGLACHGSDGESRFSDDKGHVFTGYFVVRAFRNSIDEVERTILLVRILSEENGGVWGFSPPHPYVGPEHQAFIVDSDDTAYVLRTCRLLGATRSCDCLLRFYRENVGAFVTFDAGQEGRLCSTPAFENNMACHPEVNANVFLCLSETILASTIRDDLIGTFQSSDGSWGSYFYPSRYFGTALFLELLSQRNWDAGPVLSRAKSFLSESQQHNGSWDAANDVHESALGLEASVWADVDRERLVRGVAFLLDAQQPDGSWSSEQPIWRYPDRGGDVWTAQDVNGAYVTSRCAFAIGHAAARISGQVNS